jgi:starch-binding outer membrane protein SusE/F
MKKNLIIYLTFIGLISIVTGCENDGTITTMLDNPVVPTIKTMPDLTLLRANGTQTLEFVGTSVDPGFTASATYYLEACVSGTDFADPVTIYSGVQDTLIKITVSDLNGMLLKKFDSDVASAADFRIRSVLVVDSGTGAPGTSTDPMEYSSSVKTVDVTPYGLPRLDLINSGRIQKIESALGDGNYLGYVWLSAENAFTLEDPDADIIYGTDNEEDLVADGPAIPVAEDGWYKLTVSTNDLTYVLKLFNVGLIGSATPNGWSDPDQKMEYDAQVGYWYITLDLIVGECKFRINDVWDDGINLGIGDDDNPDYTISNLWNNGSSQNIPVTEAGNYTVKLYIGTSTYSCTFTKN